MKNKKPSALALVLIILYFTFAIGGGVIIFVNADLINASHSNYIELNEKSEPTYVHVTLEDMEDVNKINQVIYVKNSTNKKMMYDINFISLNGDEDLGKVIQVDIYRNGEKQNFSGTLEEVLSGGRTVYAKGGKMDIWRITYTFDDSSATVASHSLQMELAVKISVYSV